MQTFCQLGNHGNTSNIFTLLCVDSLQQSSLNNFVKLMIDFWCLYATFSNIMATSFSDGRGRSTWREPPTMGNW